MKIAIYCVTYNSYKELDCYLESIERAVSKSVGVYVSVFIGDNTVGAKDIVFTSERAEVRQFKFAENLGYFGAVRRMMETVTPLEYDYSIVSNVDIMLDEDFFSVLVSRPSDSKLGWIAPQIFSELEKRDRNPKITNRYGKKRIILFRFCFKYPIIHYLYTKTLYRRKKFQSHAPGHIYAGHGSCIILGRRYFECCGIIDYPVFLFGEEIYLAENCMQNGLYVDYDPTVKVRDGEHTSTAKIRKKSYYRFNWEAMDYVLKTYYRSNS